MSAYDMQFSDAIYGTQEGGRYVSKGRVKAMLDKEFSLVLERVGTSRPRSSRYFSYAATVSAKSFNRDNECHSWCGIRVQMYPGAEPSDILVHVRMREESAEQQQDTLGILGVNLIYAAFYYFEDARKIIDSLSDNLHPEAIEIDSIEFRGPYFEDLDNRAMNLHLIRSWKTRAIMFEPDGQIAIPAEMLYKKNVLTIRGSFRPVTRLNVDMIEQGFDAFSQQNGVEANNSIVMAEISLNDHFGKDLMVPEEDLLARVSLLNALGYSVMVSDYTRYFSLRAYFRQFTALQIGIVLGMANIKEIFDEDKYVGVEGGMLEGFGKLFPDNTRLFIYPELNAQKEVADYTSAEIAQNVRFLYKHLLENNFIAGINCSDPELLKIYSREVLSQMSAGRNEWEQSVPAEAAELIKSNGLFGYRG